jgi:predicted nucleotidyltransferase
VTQPIPGLPAEDSQRLLAVLAGHPAVEQVWLYGSRAMGRHRRGSDIDLCIKGPQLSHAERLELMGTIDDLLLPWQVDLSLWSEVNDDLRAHLQRVGLPLLTRRSRAVPASDRP